MYLILLNVMCYCCVDSRVYLHLKEKKNQSFEDNNVNILPREDGWSERGVKESIFIKL